MEWAFDGQTFRILRVRPISDSSIYQGVAPDKIWTRANIGEVLPYVVTPLTWALFKTMLTEQPLLEDVPLRGGENDKGDKIALIKGRGYIRLDFFLNSFCYLPFVTPNIMGQALGIKLPPNMVPYNKPRGIAVRLAQWIFILTILGIVPYLSILVKRLSPLDSAKGGRLEELVKWIGRCFRLHFKCTAYAIGAFSFLSYVLRRWMPQEADSFLPLILIGHGNVQTASQGISLLELARYLDKKPLLKEMIRDAQSWTSTREQVEQVEGGPQFLSMFQKFLDSNGARTAGEFELALPRWREDPNFLLGTILSFSNASSANFPFKDRKTRAEMQKEGVDYILASLRPFQRNVFMRLLDSYRNFSTLRENMKYRLVEGYAELRKVFMHIGDTLVHRRILVRDSDIFFLKPQEIFHLMNTEGSDKEIGRLIEERRRQHSLLELEHTPDLIIYDKDEISSSTDNIINGIGCSPGVVEGAARVLYNISDTQLLKPGEILVAPHTDPGWTPLFLICRGIVTEIGGFLSHGATVAREYGIPCVVNVPEATTRINTGDLIRVDGTKGLVTKIDEINPKM